MTLLSAFIGAALAGIDGRFDWFYFGLVVVGLLLAHASNNMVNDLFDVRHGVDTEDYPRASYAPHPLLSKLTTVRGLVSAILVCNFLELAIAIYLTLVHGLTIMLFAGGGLLVSVLYVAPPLRLKHHGLGELAIFAIWGPLMIGGSYYALAGQLPVRVVYASVPYGLAVMAVLMGKHLDKRTKDARKGVHTLPVLLGDGGGRIIMAVCVFAFFVVSILCVVLGYLPVFTLIIFLALPRSWTLASTLQKPLPSSPKAAFDQAVNWIPKDLKAEFAAQLSPKAPSKSTGQRKLKAGETEEDGRARTFLLWPLWYVVWGVWWVRLAGALFVAGLVLAWISVAWDWVHPFI
jgi:1,4-dihydroxy-2-naphthoate octaprenyltransferase